LIPLATCTHALIPTRCVPLCTQTPTTSVFQHSRTHNLLRNAHRKLLSNAHLRMTCCAMHAGTVSTTARIAGGDPKAFHHRAIQTLSTKTATMMSVSMPGAHRMRCDIVLRALLFAASACAHFLRCEWSCVLFYSLFVRQNLRICLHEALLFIFGRFFLTCVSFLDTIRTRLPRSCDGCMRLAALTRGRVGTAPNLQT
jgi:hypothetical protein